MMFRYRFNAWVGMPDDDSRLLSSPAAPEAEVPLSAEQGVLFCRASNTPTPFLTC